MKKVKKAIALPERDILDCLPSALLVLNAQGQVLWLNKAAESLLGASLRGQAWREVIWQAFAPKDDDGHEVSLVNGRRVHVAISSLGSLPGQLVTLTDLTTPRDYEQAKARHESLAAIGRMTAQLVHQIRTPLASAILYTEHLATKATENSRDLQWIFKLQDCHESIEQQLKDLLLLARGEMLTLSLTCMKNWVNDLAARAEPLLASHAVKLQIKNQVGQAKVLMHAESLMGALLNLIINAKQANAEQIVVSLNSLNKKGLRLQVKDNGQGMTEEVQAQAFSPFFTTKAQGSGLGLAVVQAVVKAHHGEALLRSAPGQGCCITLNLPG